MPPSAGSWPGAIQRTRLTRAALDLIGCPMNFDDQLRRFFGTCDLDTLTPAALAGGIEHMRVDFGLATDQGRRFAMWSLLYLLGAAPDLDVAFKNAADRDAARNFMDMMDKAAGR
jgi:hypothetical protein